jgi:hypothetical protein
MPISPSCLMCLLKCLPACRSDYLHAILCFYLIPAPTNFLLVSPSCLSDVPARMSFCMPPCLPSSLLVCHSLCYLQSCLSLCPTYLSPHLSSLSCPVACLLQACVPYLPFLSACLLFLLSALLSDCMCGCLFVCLHAFLPAYLLVYLLAQISSHLRLTLEVFQILCFTGISFKHRV